MPGGVIGGISGALGMQDDFQAQQAKTDPNAFKWGGPTQQDLGAGLNNANQQAATDYGQSQGVNTAQTNYLSQLQNAASGNGPSMAQAVLAQGANRAAAQATSLARSTNTANPAAAAAALRNAQQVGAAGVTNASAQAAQIKAQEQQSALGMMGGALGQQRGQDLQSMGMGNQMAGQYLGAQMGQAQSQLTANEAQQQLNSANYNAAQGINAQTAAQNAQANQAVAGALMSGAGSALKMFSDAQAKTDVAPQGPTQSTMGPPKTDAGDVLISFGRTLRGKNESKPSDMDKASQTPMWALPNGYSQAKANEMLDARANDTRPPMHDPSQVPPTLAQVMGRDYGGGVPPVGMGGAPTDISDVIGGNPNGAHILSPNMAVAVPAMPTQPQLAHAQATVEQQYAPFASHMPSYDPSGSYNVSSGIDMKSAVEPSSDAHAKEEAYAAGVAHGQSVLTDPSRPPHRLLNSWYPTREYVGPGGSGFSMFQETGDANGRSKLVKQKVENLADVAPVRTVVPVTTPHDYLRLGQDGGREQEPPVGASLPPPPHPMIELDEPPPAQAAQPMIELDEPPQAQPQMQAAGGVYSDERLKEPGMRSEADMFLDHLKPYTYRYKDPTNEPSSRPTGGRYLGVMAQDVEQAPNIGRQIVKDTPRGKVLEGGALMSALAGGVGRLHERLNALEGKRGM